MTFQTAASKPGREIFWLVELDLDFCANTFGQAPCTASAAAGLECYNTRKSCQDPANFSATKKTYRFSPMSYHEGLPADLGDAIPALMGEPGFASSEAEPGSLGRRASVTIRLHDFVAPDQVHLDPYIATRLPGTTAAGTWFARFRARNPFYSGRPMRVYEGYLDEPFANWRQRSYIIDEMTGPDTRGTVTIKGKDPLKLADSDKARVPHLVNVRLASDISSNQTNNIEIDQNPEGWTSNQHVLIGSERIILGNQQTDTRWSQCTRGFAGTTAVAHLAGAQVNETYYVIDTRVEQVIYDLLVNFANIDPALIPLADWQAEMDTFLPAQTITGEIWKPKGVAKVLNDELLPENNIMLFWDELANQVKLLVGSMFKTVSATLNEEDHIASDVKIKDAPRRQVTRALMWYAPNSAESAQSRDSKDMTRLEAFISSVEASDQYDQVRNRDLVSRWFQPGDGGKALLTCQEMVRRFDSIPQEMSFQIDAKDITGVKLGDVVDVFTDAYTNLDGRRTAFRGQVMKERALVPAHLYELTLLKYFPPEEVTLPDEYRITANIQNFDLWVALGGPPQAFEITVYIEANVIVSSSTPDTAAFTTGAVHPDTVVHVVRELNALVVGMGGTGADGADAYNVPSPTGGKGGDAMEFTCDGDLDNDPGGGDTGYIASGGGGGGGAKNTLNALNDLIHSLPGGGGAGRDGGQPGTDSPNGNSPPDQPAQPGTDTAGGAGAFDDSNPTTYLGYGGTGGALGTEGDPGFSGDGNLAPVEDGAGGQPGWSINRNGNNVTVLSGATAPQLVGPVSP